MCSVLLVLLILVVTFDTFHHFSQSSNLEKEESKSKSPCTRTLVLPQKRHCHSGQEQFAQSQEDSGPTSLKRFTFFTDHTGSNVATDRSIPVALFELQSHQQEDGDLICQMLCTLEKRDPTQHGAEECALHTVTMAAVARVENNRSRLVMEGASIKLQTLQSEAQSSSQPWTSSRIPTRTPADQSQTPDRRKARGNNPAKGREMGAKPIPRIQPSRRRCNPLEAARLSIKQASQVDHSARPTPML